MNNLIHNMCGIISKFSIFLSHSSKQFYKNYNKTASKFPAFTLIKIFTKTMNKNKLSHSSMAMQYLVKFTQNLTSFKFLIFLHSYKQIDLYYAQNYIKNFHLFSHASKQFDKNSGQNSAKISIFNAH